MSILIKGMKMPEGEKEKVILISKGKAIELYRMLLPDLMQKDFLHEHEVIEVLTPHGRLIDVNTVLHDEDLGCIDELVNDPLMTEEFKVGVKAARIIVCSAPTIIEAEEQE